MWIRPKINNKPESVYIWRYIFLSLLLLDFGQFRCTFKWLRERERESDARNYSTNNRLKIVVNGWLPHQALVIVCAYSPSEFSLSHDEGNNNKCYRTVKSMSALEIYNDNNKSNENHVKSKLFYTSRLVGQTQSQDTNRLNNF